MLLTVEGIYSDGKVELTETPTGGPRRNRRSLDQGCQYPRLWAYSCYLITVFLSTCVNLRRIPCTSRVSSCVP